ncbi:hypothetical protein [Paenibacillus sp. sgz5001063]|uniref:hypothetical protein n=1 Tax=Paenibacillus sp. sgz5001063 TaxID=3242474 RepID=UPI0036D287E1
MCPLCPADTLNGAPRPGGMLPRRAKELEPPPCLLRKSGGALATGGALLRQKRRLTAPVQGAILRLAAGFEPGGWSDGEEVWNWRSEAFAFMFGFLPRTAVQIKEIQT